MKDRNYYNTFITVAPDCPVQTAVIPISKRAEKSIPQWEYELLSEQPYHFTQDELQFSVHVERQGIAPSERQTRHDELWQEFFSKSRACLRASLLPKKFGWGLHFNAEGRIAIVPMESEQYQRFAAGSDDLKVLKAMRNKKA